MTDYPLTRTTRAYRTALALLLPPRFHHQFAHHMLAVFADLEVEARQAAGERGALAALASELPGLVRLALRERRAERAARSHLPHESTRRRPVLETLRQDLRVAARALRRAPSFSIAAILTLTLGIGAATAVFSVVNAVLLRPLPYDHPEQLVALSHTLSISGASRIEQSDATYLYYSRASRAFTGIAAYRSSGANLGAPAGSEARVEQHAERVASARVSASTFGVLRVGPLRGRAFGAGDEQLGAPPVVLVSEGLWRNRYASDPGLVGRRIDVDGVSREVVGIMPASFGFPEAHTQLWVPLVLDPQHTASAAFDYQSIARLRTGTSIATAAADLQRLLPEVPEAFPGRLTAAAIRVTKMRAVVHPLRDEVVGDIGQVLWVVLAAAAFVLLVACANVANLFLVRAEGRTQELAVRRALGAPARAITAAFLAESSLLAVAGGVLGLALAAAGVRVLRALPAGMQIPRIDEVSIDGRVLGVTAGIIILAALLISVIPALRSASLVLSALLGSAGRSVTAGRTQQRARQALVVAQLALTLALLSGAGLMARSFLRLRAVQPGFEPAHALTFRVALPASAYPAPEDPARFIIRALDEIAATPGVQAVGAATKLPLASEARQDTALFVEDRPILPGTLPALHQVVYASPGYFRAMGIPLLQGSTFQAPDPARAPREVIVSRSVAERYWKGEHIIGKRVRMDARGPWQTIIGVTGDVRGTALEQPPDETIYVPLVVALGGDTTSGARFTPRDIGFVARSARAPELVAASAERVVRTLDPSVPVYAVRPMRDVVSRAEARTTFTLLLLGIASAVALVLGAVGTFGVISYVVSLRQREIAVRLALGAPPARVLRMVLWQATAVVVLGIVLGLAGALAATRVLASLLFGVSPTDAVALAAAALMLLLVGVAASWLPARHAARVDPALALRGE